MPTKVEKDSVTGHETTGHEWDGITELNRPLPKWWLYVLYATILYSLVYYVLYPAIPGINGYTKGLLGYNQRTELDERLATARAAQQGYIERIEAATVEEIRADPELLRFANAGGAAAFAENCVPCHGSGGAGQRGYPTLADDAWLWGGTLEDIRFTLLHGVRWEQNPDTRISEMPPFGEGILEPGQIQDVASYVVSLSGKAEDTAAAERGAAVFAEQCVACHGENAQGNPELGAPNLADAVWLYGSDKAAIVSQIRRPQHGVMPAWGGRLDESTIKMLSVYVHSLGGGQ